MHSGFFVWPRAKIYESVWQLEKVAIRQREPSECQFLFSFR
jgi:hypothetical protein